MKRIFVLFGLIAIAGCDLFTQPEDRPEPVEWPTAPGFSPIAPSLSQNDGDHFEDFYWVAIRNGGCDLHVAGPHDEDFCPKKVRFKLDKGEPIEFELPQADSFMVAPAMGGARLEMLGIITGPLVDYPEGKDWLPVWKDFQIPYAFWIPKGYILLMDLYTCGSQNGC